MNIADLRLQVERRRGEVQGKLGKRELLEGQLVTLQQQAKDLEEALLVEERALLVLQGFSERLRMECQQKVEALVTMGLQTVFEAPYEFVIESSIQRNVVSMRFLLRTPLKDGGHFETDLYDSVGGGILDVVSFLLRVIVLSMVRPKLSRVLLLDEVFSHVSRAHLTNVAVLLRKLSDSLGLQIILVTHSPELGEGADLVYHVKKIDGNVTVRAEKI